jgi:hypothetical protein
MGDMSQSDERRADVSWPTWFGAWPASPWVMTGRQVTAWLAVTDDVVDYYLHPDLRPPRAPEHASRIRFYELEANGERFREAAFSLPVRAAGIDGEASIALWADSERYQSWAREAFGWPVVQGEMEYAGSLWGKELAAGSQGSASLRAAEAQIELTVRDLAPADEASGDWLVRRPWLVPRRVVDRGGLAGETREVLRVTPTMNRAGRRLEGSGVLRLDLGQDNPLSEFGQLECPAEVVDDFELCVGDQVEVLSTERVDAGADQRAGGATGTL